MALQLIGVNPPSSDCASGAPPANGTVMKFTERDKILAALLPAILVIAADGLFLVRSKVAERNSVEKALADAERTVNRLLARKA